MSEIGRGKGTGEFGVPAVCRPRPADAVAPGGCLVESSRLGVALTLLVLSGAWVCQPPLSGQSVGDRVRVTTIGMTVVGEVAGLGDEGLQVLHGGSRQTFSYREITRLQRSAGRESRWKDGLLYGGGCGVVAGVVYGRLWGSACETLTGASGECDEIGLQAAIWAAMTWGAGGGLLGMGIGALIRRELWADIPVRRTGFAFRPLLVPGPRSGTLVVGARLHIGYR